MDNEKKPMSKNTRLVIFSAVLIVIIVLATIFLFRSKENPGDLSVCVPKVYNALKDKVPSGWVIDKSDKEVVVYKLEPVLFYNEDSVSGEDALNEEAVKKVGLEGRPIVAIKFEEGCTVSITKILIDKLKVFPKDKMDEIVNLEQNIIKKTVEETIK